jgi:hypothetical protein
LGLRIRVKVLRLLLCLSLGSGAHQTARGWAQGRLAHAHGRIHGRGIRLAGRLAVELTVQLSSRCLSALQLAARHRSARLAAPLRGAGIGRTVAHPLLRDGLSKGLLA